MAKWPQYAQSDYSKTKTTNKNVHKPELFLFVMCFSLIETISGNIQVQMSESSIFLLQIIGDHP